MRMIENEDAVDVRDVAAARLAKRAAMAKALDAAKAFFGARFESWEVWEAGDDEVIVRAWDADGDYDFFNARINNN